MVISGTQRAYGEWYARSIKLDNLYRDTPVRSVTRQVRRRDSQLVMKELKQVEKRKARKNRLVQKRHKAQATMTDIEMKSGEVTI